MHITEEQSERHVLSLTVANEAGILARIAGMFTARGYNIESLTVADITQDHSISRITIVTNGPPRSGGRVRANKRPHSGDPPHQLRLRPYGPSLRILSLQGRGASQ